jgi:hypothetical protein
MFVIEPITTISYPHCLRNFFPRDRVRGVQCNYYCSGFDGGKRLFVLRGCCKKSCAGLIHAFVRAMLEVNEISEPYIYPEIPVITRQCANGDTIVPSSKLDNFFDQSVMQTTFNIFYNLEAKTTYTSSSAALSSSP